MREEFLLKFDDTVTIKGYIWRNDNPNQKVRGTIQIAHGMAEHITRYDAFANYMTSRGYIVIGQDHYGHGESVNSIDEIGIIEDYDFMDAIIKTMKFVRNEFEDEFQKGTAYLFAHSMGSMAACRYIEKHPNDFNKVILSGTTKKSIKSVFGRLLAKMEMKKHGKTFVSEKLNNLTFKPFNKKYRLDDEKYGWLSVDKENIKNYNEDKYCGKDFPVNYLYSMTTLLNEIVKKDNLNRINKKCQILLLSGAGDPVTNYTKDTKKLYKMYNSQGIKTKMIVYQNARHEILNESAEIKEKVYADIENFLR